MKIRKVGGCCATYCIYGFSGAGLGRSNTLSNDSAEGCISELREILFSGGPLASYPNYENLHYCNYKTIVLLNNNQNPLYEKELTILGFKLLDTYPSTNHRHDDSSIYEWHRAPDK